MAGFIPATHKRRLAWVFMVAGTGPAMTDLFYLLAKWLYALRSLALRIP